MIVSLEVKNFRSLISVKTDFEGLTALVGANGSGKSNLIKALEFISSMTTKGLEPTITSMGGFDTLLPKALVRQSRRDAKIELGYKITLFPPIENSPSDLEPVEAQVELVKFFQTTSRGF